MSSPDSDPVHSNKGGAYFPQSYLTDMFRFLGRHRDEIKIITYEDLDWQEDLDYENGYPQEKQRWLKGIKNSEIDPSKAYLLIQYDLDSRPERSMSLLSHPDHIYVPANIMLFAKRVNRRLLKATNELEYTDYEIDDELLRRLIHKKFIVGYHSNCYERSYHNLTEAPKILNSDINELKKRFDINFYTAHGGVPCENGTNNRDVMPCAKTVSQVRWVHNGATPFFNKQFSDGGHNSLLRDPSERDIRDFVSNMMPGGRYRILVHPQYYGVEFGSSKRYAGTMWYDKLLQNTIENPDSDSWSTTKLINFTADTTKAKERSRSPVVNSRIYRIKKRFFNHMSRFLRKK